MLFIFSLLSIYSIIHKGAEFLKGDSGSIRMSALSSNQNLFPIDLSFLCDNSSFHTDFSLATNLIGNEIHTKSFEFQYLDSKKKEILICSKEIDRKDFEYLIQNGYRLNFNLNRFKVRDNDTIGLLLGEDSAIFNSFTINVHYKVSNKTGKKNEVTGLTGFSETKKRLINQNNLTFSFSLKFTKKETGFNDQIFNTTIHQIYFLVMIILNIIFVFLLIYLSVKSDNDTDSKENSIEIDFEENFWYFMRGDIFRKPKYLSLLCSLTGLGLQVFLASFFTSFMTYNSSTTVIHAFLFYFLFFSLFEGILSVRLFKLSDGADWRTLIFYNIFLAPIAFIVIFSIGQLSTFKYLSSNRLTFSNFMKIVCAISIDMFLSLIGSIVSLTMKVPQLPFKVNLIPKQHVKQPFYLKGFTRISIIGVFVFLNVGLSFDLILNMIYGLNTIYVSPVLPFELILLLFLCSFSSSLFFLYICVKRESYNWWWCTFLGPAFCGVCYICVAIVFFFVNEIGDLTSFVLFLATNSLIGVAFASAAGFCGFWSCFLFLRLLYGSLA